MSGESALPSSARGSYELGAGEACVWAAALDLDEHRLRFLDGVLSSDERERAGRLVVPLHGKRFIAARGVLRTILARCAGTEPAKIAFSYGPRGKPFLSTAAGTDDIRFNVSHAADRALVAVTKGREIGVDIESIDRRRFEAEIVHRFFSPRDESAIRSAPEAARAGLFAAFWARKEACLKASGLGISFPLASFDVSGDAREPRAVVPGGDDAGGALSWTLVDVEAVPGFAAACAVEGAGLIVTRREFRF